MSTDSNDIFKTLASMSDEETIAALEALRKRLDDAEDRSVACQGVILGRLVELTSGASNDPVIVTAAKALEGDDDAYGEILEMIKGSKG
jgi:hypothetical protein